MENGYCTDRLKISLGENSKFYTFLGSRYTDIEIAVNRAPIYLHTMSVLIQNMFAAKRA